MKPLPVDYYIEKLNHIPARANEILHSIRTLDKQILKHQIDIDTRRKEVLLLTL